MSYLRYKFYRWFMRFLTVKSPFLEASFSRNLIHFQIFYLKNTLPNHFCCVHVVNPGQEWQEAHFRVRAGRSWDTCCAGSEHEMSNRCCLAPQLSGGGLSCFLDPGSPWLYPKAWSSLSSCFSSSTWFTLCEALTLGPQENIFIL